MKTFIKKNNKIIFFLNIFFLLILLINHSSTLLAIPNFENHSQHDIKLSPTSELERRWLAKQPKMQVYHRKIQSLDDAVEILSHYGIRITKHKKYFNEKGYSFKPFNILNRFEFGIIPENFITCYFVPRNNPFHKDYFYSNTFYHLDELLSKEDLIEKVFVFWNIDEEIEEFQPNIHLIQQDIYSYQNKTDEINNWLMRNKIISKPRIIQLGCYNPTNYWNLVFQLPSNLFQSKTIDAIYFDDGERGTLKNTNDRTYSINDLLKLSNGAKNIYLFSFNIKQKEIKNITLPDNQDPYNAIRTWKRENKLYAFPPLTKQNDFITKKLCDVNHNLGSWIYYNYDDLGKKVLDNTIIVSQQFETANAIYNISCSNFEYLKQLRQDYKDAMAKWQNHSYFKPRELYDHEDLRIKLGKSSKWLYDEFGNKYWYQYNVGWFYDDWDIDADDFRKMHYEYDYRYKLNRYYDTIEPPKKPKELD